MAHDIHQSLGAPLSRCCVCFGITEVAVTELLSLKVVPRTLWKKKKQKRKEEKEEEKTNNNKKNVCVCVCVLSLIHI